MQKLKQMILAVAAIFALATPILATAPVAAQPSIDKALCAGANLDVNDTTCEVNDVDAGTRVNQILTKVINVFSFIVGVVAVIMIIIGGLRYITSGGDSGNITAAKNTILYAVIGLVIVALAQIIVRFVLAKVNGS